MVNKFFLPVLLLFFSCSVYAANDPTAPLNWSTPASPKRVLQNKLPQLQSIICQQKTACRAVLNEQVVNVGDNVSGYLVRKIDNNSVIVSRGARQWQLNVFDLDIKK